MTGKKTKALSGASQDAYFRRVLKAYVNLPGEDRDRLVCRLRQDIAQVRLRRNARTDSQSPPAPDPTASPAPTASPFDPFSPNVIVVVRKWGRDAALAALGAIETPDQLRQLAHEQRLAVPTEVLPAAELRTAIVTAAERRIANRRAAAS